MYDAPFNVLVNDIVRALLAHRTIRSFDPEAEIPDDEVMVIVRAGQQAPTSCTGQMYTVINISKERRAEVFNNCGKQNFVMDASHFFIICVDLHRLFAIVDRVGGTNRKWPLAGLQIGIFDAGLMAQNMTIAAEAMGYGTAFCGSCGDRPEELIEILKLPKYVVPLTGLAIGVPTEDPPARPRLPTSMVFHKDVYREYLIEELEAGIDEMDVFLRAEGYYSKYSGKEDYGWRDHMKNKFGGKWLETVEKRRRAALQRQGFL